MILVNTEYISGKEIEMLGLVKGSTIQSKHWAGYYPKFQEPLSAVN